MIIIDAAHLMESPFIVRRKADGKILYDTRPGWRDLPPDVASLVIKSIRCFSDSLYPVIIFDV